MTARAHPELDLQRAIVGTKPPGLAVIFGWEHVHFRPAMTKHGFRTPGSGSMAKGWPDLTLVRPRDRRLIFAELKSDVAKPTPEQDTVLGILRELETGGEPSILATGRGPQIEVYVWRPRDLDDIARILR